MDNVWVVDTKLLSNGTLNHIRTSGEIGKKFWFANIDDSEVSASTFNQKDGTATLVQTVPCPSGRVCIARQGDFTQYLTMTEFSSFRAGRNIISLPFATSSLIVAGAPREREVYFIDGNTMRVGVIIY